MPSYWSCRKCSFRNERTSSRTCQGCGEKTKPKRRVPKHAEVLRDTGHGDWALVSVLIHGGERGACACCRKPEPDGYRHERDHGHKRDEHAYGKARGILCTRCNKLLVGSLSLAEARAVVAYLERCESYYESERIEA